MGMSLSKLREFVMDREAWRAVISSWGCKESDTTERLNWTELKVDEYKGKDLKIKSFININNKNQIHIQ